MLFEDRLSVLISLREKYAPQVASMIQSVTASRLSTDSNVA